MPLGPPDCGDCLGGLSVAEPSEQTAIPRPSAGTDAKSDATNSIDREAVDAAHARFGPGLRQFFQARLANFRGNAGRDDDSVDDLCQQTWGECWKSVRDGRYDPARAALSTFLYAVASNIWLRHRRKAMNSREILDESEQVAQSCLGTEPDPARTVGFSELIEAVLSCVSGSEGELSAGDRAVLLALSRGATDRDLAFQLNVAPSTAHARRVAALSKLRAALTELGYRADDRSAER